MQSKQDQTSAGNSAEEEVREVPIEDIVLCDELQPREKMSHETVAEYTEAMEKGANMPPGVAFNDGGPKFCLTDGFHRLPGWIKSGRKTIPVKVKTGTKRDALLWSVGANAAHGLRRTNEDKRRAVLTLLKDAEWGEWSNSMIADKCRVDDTLVGDIRRETSSGGPKIRMFVRNGKRLQMKTAGIGTRKRKACPAAQDAPVAPVLSAPEPATKAPEVMNAEQDKPAPLPQSKAPENNASAPATKGSKPKNQICGIAIEAVDRAIKELDAGKPMSAAYTAAFNGDQGNWDALKAAIAADRERKFLATAKPPSRRRK